MPAKIKYQNDTYEHVEGLHCPHCGNLTVFMCDGGCDYYCGESHVCCTCGACFTIQGLFGVPDDPSSDPQIKALRGVCLDHLEGE